MTRAEAIARVRALLGAAATSLTDTDLDDILAQSVTIDSAGRMPADEDWTPTYEPYWAAGLAAERLAVAADLAGGVLRWSSEGTTVERKAPDFHAAARGLFAASPLTALARAAGTTAYIDIPAGIDFDPRSEGWPG